VFLRADAPEVAAAVGLAGKTAADVFGELRERKNKS
jgi:hydroxyacylglutathione hydrolase